jgi:hypothetical protein
VKQISATRDHIIARVIPRMSVPPLAIRLGFFCWISPI